MAKSFKRSSGLIQRRTAGGRFRKTTLADIGINNANSELQVYICNVCEKEFVPIVHSGTCCGVDNKRKKVIELTPEKQAIRDKINELRSKPFINKQILEQIQQLEREFINIKKQ